MAFGGVRGVSSVNGAHWGRVPALGLLGCGPWGRGGNPDPVGVRSLVPTRRLGSSRASQRGSLSFCGPGPAEGRPWALGVPSTTGGGAIV